MTSQQLACSFKVVPLDAEGDALPTMTTGQMLWVGRELICKALDADPEMVLTGKVREGVLEMIARLMKL